MLSKLSMEISNFSGRRIFLKIKKCNPSVLKEIEREWCERELHSHGRQASPANLVDLVKSFESHFRT